MLFCDESERDGKRYDCCMVRAVVNIISRMFLLQQARRQHNNEEQVQTINCIKMKFVKIYDVLCTRPTIVGMQ